MLLHYFLPFLFSAPLISAFQSNLPSNDCIDVICPEQEEIGRLGLLDWREDLLDAENKPLEKCRDCQDCTNSGYSVCVQPRHFDAERQRLITDEDHCECAHSGPTILMGMDAKNATEYPNQEHRPKHMNVKCKLLAGGNVPPPKVEPEMDLGDGIFRICYASALRKLPTPNASNEKGPEEGMQGHPVLVTVSQFWLADYWQTLRPRHLHLFYVFPVSRKDMCEGKAIMPTAQDLMWINVGKTRDQINHLGLPYMCKASLNIVMSGLEPEVHAESSAEKEKRKQQEGIEEDEEEEDDYDYNAADPDLPPEVQFERDVFFGAEKVRFYYELKVHRENLLKIGPGGKLKFESRLTNIMSDTLDFDLEPEIYGTGMPRSGSSHSAGPSMRNASRIDRVNIEEHQHKIGDKMDLTKETREPIVRPIYGRTGKGGKSAERGKSATTTTKAGTHQTETMGTSQSTPSSASSNEPSRHIQSRPISDPVHQIDQSTVVPAPSSNVDSEGEYTEESEGPMDDVRTLEPVTISTSSKSPNSQISGREDPTEEDWLLLRNVLIVALILLATFVLLALCYKRGLCCFPARGPTNGGQQRNGKTRIQNGKKYSQTGK